MFIATSAIFLTVTVFALMSVKDPVKQSVGDIVESNAKNISAQVISTDVLEYMKQESAVLVNKNLAKAIGNRSKRDDVFTRTVLADTVDAGLASRAFSADKTKLLAVRIFDKKLKHLGTLNNKNKEHSVVIKGERLPGTLHENTLKLKGGARLKTQDRMWADENGHMLYSVIVPAVSGLSLNGYVELIFDPSHNWLKLEASFNAPVATYSADGKELQRSPKWAEILEFDGEFGENWHLIKVPVIDSEGQGVGEIHIYQEISGFLSAFSSILWTVILVVIGISIAIVLFALSKIRKDFAPLEEMSEAMLLVKSGDFGKRLEVRKEDEVGIVSKSLNELLDSLQLAISEANNVIEDLSKGKFDKRVEADLDGELKVLKDGVNNSADVISETMIGLSNAIASMRDGKFDTVIELDSEGAYKDIANDTQTTLNGLNETISGILSVMSDMKEGQFSSRVEIDAKGDLGSLKDSINAAMSSLESAISEINSVVSSQAEGDMTKMVEGDYNGGLSELKASINQTATKLNDIVMNVINSANAVSTSSQKVLASSNDISSRTQSQAAMLEETAASMEEMTATVQQNTEAAQKVSELSNEASQIAKDGLTIADKAVESMQAITESSQKISDIISLIDGIAFQTNLLALNAAVEAARAGEHGRGFAVVAGEVRSLAQKSAEASKDIKTLIENSAISVQEGGKFVTETGEALSNINSSIEKVNKNITEISIATSEQARGISQVNTAVNEMDQGTQKNAIMVVESADISESLSAQAKDLTETMSFFKTGESSFAEEAPGTAMTQGDVREY